MVTHVDSTQTCFSLSKSDAKIQYILVSSRITRRGILVHTKAAQQGQPFLGATILGLHVIVCYDGHLQFLLTRKEPSCFS